MQAVYSCHPTTQVHIEMSFEDAHRTVFMVYRVFGLVPFQFHLESSLESQKTIPKKWRRNVRLIVEHLWFISMLLIELYILIHTCMLCYDHSIKVSFDVYRTLHFSIVFTIRSLIILITIESYFKRNVQVQIMNNFREIDRKFSEKLDFEINYHRLRRQIANSFLFRVFMYITAIALLVPAYWNESFEQKMLAMFVIYALMKRSLSASSYTTYALLVKCRIEAMHEIFDNNLLLVQQNSVEICRDQQTSNDREAFELRRMINLQRIFSKIHDTVQLLNNSFRWSISVNFTINVFDISVAVFSAFDKVMDSLNAHVIYVSYTWAPLALHYVFSLVTIIQAANSLNKEADKLAHQIHRIQSCGIESDELRDLVSKEKK